MNAGNQIETTLTAAGHTAEAGAASVTLHTWFDMPDLASSSRAGSLPARLGWKGFEAGLKKVI